MLLRLISDRRSSGDERREEKRIAGPSSSSWLCCSSGSLVDDATAGVEMGCAVVGGWEVMEGVEDSRREA